jgi:hypothetical protein
VLEDALDAPETTSGENGGLGAWPGHLVNGRRRDDDGILGRTRSTHAERE